MFDKISDLNNSCTLKAVQEVSRADDAAILAAFKNHGYVPNKGMLHDKWTAAAQELGLQLEDVNLNGLPTLAEFVRMNPVGVFFLSVTGHALVARNGKVVESIKGKLGLRRRVKRAKRVLNAPELVVQKGTQLKVLVKAYSAKRYGTESYKRYDQMAIYLQIKPNATLQDIFNETTYTQADYVHDLKKA